MEGRIIAAHVLFLVINLFVVFDFWQTRQVTDQVTDVQRKIVYSTSKTIVQSHAFELYEISTLHYSFTIPTKYVSAFKKNTAITVYCTRFLHIIRRIEVDNQSIPISFGLYAPISLLVVAIAIAALFLSEHPDFQLFSAIINALLSLMVIYMIWF